MRPGVAVGLRVADIRGYSVGVVVDLSPDALCVETAQGKVWLNEQCVFTVDCRRGIELEVNRAQLHSCMVTPPPRDLC